MSDAGHRRRRRAWFPRALSPVLCPLYLSGDISDLSASGTFRQAEPLELLELDPDLGSGPGTLPQTSQQARQGTRAGRGDLCPTLPAHLNRCSVVSGLRSEVPRRSGHGSRCY